jgi:hypothetical protein
VHDNNLEIKVHIESKLSLIQSLDEEDWIKSMCIKHIFYHDCKVSCLWFMTYYQKKKEIKNKYNNNNKFIIFLKVMDVFHKKRLVCIYCFKIAIKTYILNGFQFKTFNF